MIHIFYNYWEYGEEYIREYAEDGAPMWDSHQRRVDVAFCGEQGYEGELEFAYDPEDSDCDNCIEAWVMETLGDLP